MNMQSYRHYSFKMFSDTIKSGRLKELADQCNVLYDLRDRIIQFNSGKSDVKVQLTSEEVFTLWNCITKETTQISLIDIIYLFNELAFLDFIPHGSFVWKEKINEKHIVHQVLKYFLNQRGQFYFDNSFYGWKLENENGQTLAHVAAVHGLLPDTFNQWDMKDKYGTTVGMVHSFFLLAGTTLEN